MSVRLEAAKASLPYEFSRRPTELWHAGQDGGDMRYVVEVPEMCDTVEEWAERYGNESTKIKTIN